MLFSSATIFFPTPTFLLPIFFGRALPHPFFVGIVAGLGSTIGECTGYLAGFSGSAIMQKGKWYEQVKLATSRYGFFAILIIAFIPNPFFDLAGIASGALGMKWWKFFLATGIGKILRSILLAYAGSLTLSP